MRVTLQRDGGFAVFPGLQRPYAVDTSELDAADASELEVMIEAATHAHRARRQPRPGPTAGADQITYTIEIVDDADHRHVVRATDPVEDPTVRALIDRLEELRRAS